VRNFEMPIWKKQPPLDVLAPSLHAWFGSELGSAILAVEQRLLNRSLTDCFGYYLLQLGIDSELDLFGDCRVQRCFKAGPTAPRPKRDAADSRTHFVRCDFGELPFECDSIDVIVVHHVLEFATNPHAVLRELHRVLVPRGRIVLIGFNPWSPFGARMIAGRLRGNSIWRNHLLSAPRMNDWLQLLGFETERIDYGFNRLPLHRAAHWPNAASESNILSRRWPLGGVYAITAIKEVAKFIPLKPTWAKPRAVLTPLVPKPTSAVGQRQTGHQ
jgi:SAM-dependent methyltransferase